jgi:hypothetical protein
MEEGNPGVRRAGLREGYGATISSAVRDITGRAPRTFRDFARDHADRFRSGR